MLARRGELCFFLAGCKPNAWYRHTFPLRARSTASSAEGTYAHSTHTLHKSTMRRPHGLSSSLSTHNMAGRRRRPGELAERDICRSAEPPEPSPRSKLWPFFQRIWGTEARPSLSRTVGHRPQIWYMHAYTLAWAQSESNVYEDLCAGILLRLICMLEMYEWMVAFFDGYPCFMSSLLQKALFRK